MTKHSVSIIHTARFLEEVFPFPSLLTISPCINCSTEAGPKELSDAFVAAAGMCRGIGFGGYVKEYIIEGSIGEHVIGTCCVPIIYTNVLLGGSVCLSIRAL